MRAGAEKEEKKKRGGHNLSKECYQDKMICKKTDFFSCAHGLIVHYSTLIQNQKTVRKQLTRLPVLLTLW